MSKVTLQVHLASSNWICMQVLSLWERLDGLHAHFRTIVAQHLLFMPGFMVPDLLSLPTWSDTMEDFCFQAPLRIQGQHVTAANDQVGWLVFILTRMSIVRDVIVDFGTGASETIVALDDLHEFLAVIQANANGRPVTATLDHAVPFGDAIEMLRRSRPHDMFYLGANVPVPLVIANAEEYVVLPNASAEFLAQFTPETFQDEPESDDDSNL